MKTTENEHRKFELNALRYRQPVQFPEQWRYVLVLPFGVDQSSSSVKNRLKAHCQPSTHTGELRGLQMRQWWKETARHAINRYNSETIKAGLRNLGRQNPLKKPQQKTHPKLNPVNIFGDIIV